MQPKANNDGMIVSDFGDELVVYDQAAQQVHNLNRTSAMIWRQCDGQASVEQIAAAVRAELQMPAVDTAFVMHGLQELQTAGLIQGERQFTRRTGVAAGLALLLPVVATIVAPTPAMAASGPPLTF